jgi:class 3 adenylate cyclase
MFCDLVDSTPLAQRLDPEELRDILREYQRACAEEIGRYGGHVARYMGDGILAYFGYPQAHEDDPQRAVRAGLAITEAVRSLDLDPGAGRRLAVRARVGVHTGLVVLGEMGSGERRERADVVGDVPNIASRVQAMADDCVVVSEATERLTRGFFHYEDMGDVALKGVARPMRLFRALSETGVTARLDAVESSGLTPMVGREEELRLLVERWERATRGAMQSVVITGEPGIGKSRLVRVLRERIAEEPHAWVELRCSQFNENSALHPLVEHFQRLMDFRADDGAGARLTKMQAALRQSDLPLDEVVPLFASLLSLPVPDGYERPVLSPEGQRRRTFDASIAWLVAESERRPVALVVEDLHWIDPSTLELLTLLMHRRPEARLFVLLTCRPEFAPPWPFDADRHAMTLGRLSHAQVQDRSAGWPAASRSPPIWSSRSR